MSGTARAVARIERGLAAIENGVCAVAAAEWQPDDDSPELDLSEREARRAAGPAELVVAAARLYQKATGASDHDVRECVRQALSAT